MAGRLSDDGTHAYTLYWAPEGRPLCNVQAKTEWGARKKAPMPYRRYLREVYAVRHDSMTPDELASVKRRVG